MNRVAGLLVAVPPVRDANVQGVRVNNAVRDGQVGDRRQVAVEQLLGPSNWPASYSASARHAAAIAVGALLGDESSIAVFSAASKVAVASLRRPCASSLIPAMHSAYTKPVCGHAGRQRMHLGLHLVDLLEAAQVQQADVAHIEERRAVLRVVWVELRNVSSAGGERVGEAVLQHHLKRDPEQQRAAGHRVQGRHHLGRAQFLEQRGGGAVLEGPAEADRVVHLQPWTAIESCLRQRLGGADEGDQADRLR